MTSAANRELRIAIKKGIIVKEPQTYEELQSQIEVIIKRNLPNLLMYFNEKLERLGYVYDQGWKLA